jgi:hypothetical protein
MQSQSIPLLIAVFNGATTMKSPITKVAVALLILAACNGDGSSPTQPQLPVPQPPSANLSGVWTGTVSEAGIPGNPDFPDCAEPVTANFTQSGASVEGTLKDSSYSNCFGVYTPIFSGTLEGRTLTGVVAFYADPGLPASGQVEGERDDRLTITAQRMIWELRR